MEPWVNWGDFLAGNRSSLEDSDARVKAAQEEQSRLMREALARYGGAMDSETDAEGAALQRAFEALQRDTLTPVVSGAKGGMAGQATGARGAPGFAPTATSTEDAVGGATRSEGAAATSYTELMALQQKSLAVAKGMTGGESGPGWQRALYASPERAQYEDPWAKLDASVTDEKARAEARRSAMRSDYEKKRAAWLEAHAPKPEPVALPKVESAASVAFGNRTPDPATPQRSRPVPAMTPRRASDGTY